MKKRIFLGVILCSSLMAHAQDNSASKQTRFGFNLGADYTNLIINQNSKPPTGVQVANDLGFRLGLLMDVQLSKRISFSPKAELVFSKGAINFSNQGTTYSIRPMGLDFAFHSTFRKASGNLRPYLLAGPVVKLPLPEKNQFSNSFSTGYDIAIDIGIGLERPFKYVAIAPELRYSIGLMNINRNPQIQSLHGHTVSLVINFKD